MGGQSSIRVTMYRFNSGYIKQIPSRNRAGITNAAAGLLKWASASTRGGSHGQLLRRVSEKSFKLVYG